MTDESTAQHEWRLWVFRSIEAIDEMMASLSRSRSRLTEMLGPEIWYGEMAERSER